MRPSKMGLCGPLFLPLRCRPSASALCVKRVTSERSDAPSIRSDEIAPPHVGPPCRGLTTVILIQNAPIMPSFGDCFCAFADCARPENSRAPTASRLVREFIFGHGITTKSDFVFTRPRPLAVLGNAAQLRCGNCFCGPLQHLIIW